MTVVIAFGITSDGYLHSYDANYTNSRNGPADGVTGGNVAYYGQNNNSSQYAHLQAFIGFTYPAVSAADIVTSAVVRLYTASTFNAGIARDAEIRGFAWSAGGLTVADWRNATQLAALTLQGKILNVNAATGKFAYGGSDELRNVIATVTAMEFVVVTGRQRAGTVPTQDEGASISSADASGTTEDPALIFTTCPRSRLFGVLGAQATRADGYTVYLESDANATTPNIALHCRDTAGTIVSTSTYSSGTTAGIYGFPKGLQNIALAVGPDDTVYVAARSGDVENTLLIRSFTKNPGTGGYGLSNTVRTAALPTYDGAINNVAMAYHDHAGGTLVIFCGHVAGTGGYTSNELSYVIVNAPTVTTGTGTLVRASGSAIGTIVPSTSSSAYHNTYANEVGTSLDVAADRVNKTWGYVISLERGQIPGQNAPISLSRYILNASGNGFDHTSYEEDILWAYKDANSKVRAVPLGAGICCAVSADADAGWGITMETRQHSGTTAGSTGLGSTHLGDEAIASMPDGPVIGKTAAWDAVYSEIENRLWIYYVDVANARRVMRTAYDLTTMQAVRNEVQVYLHASGTAAVQALRVSRNVPVSQKGLVTIAFLDAGVYTLVHVVDPFNIAPTAPTLIPRANYDATVAALFDWTFNDPNPGDTQSAYQLEISRVSDGVVVFDSTKTLSALSERTVAGATLTNGISYYWRVRTWDAADVVSPWTSFGTFATSAGGSVTITSPATDNVFGVITDDYPVVWSVTGTTQASYRVWMYHTSTNTLISDSGWITSVALTHTISGMLSDVEYRVEVQVRNGALVSSGIGTRLITPSYATPEIPLLSVTPVPDDGYTLIDIENPTPGAPAVGSTEYGFESPGGVTGFTATNGTLTASALQAHRDTQSARLVTTGTPTSTYMRLTTSLPAVMPDVRYTARLWAYSTLARTIYVVIDWQTAGGAYISSSTAIVNLAAATWTPCQVSGTAPATAGLATFGVTMPSNPPTGAEVFVDELVLTGASDRPDVVRNDVLRRRSGENGAYELIGTTDPDGTFRDYTARSGVAYQYIARGQA